MQLVDEADNFAVRLGDLFQHGFQTIFEFAAELGARHDGAKIQRRQPLIAQLLRYVAFHDALRQTFHNGRFADAGLTDQHRVVLRAPAQHLHHTPDLVVAANHRVELAAPSHVDQIQRIALERLVLRFRILIRDPLRTTHRNQGLQNRVVVGACAIEQVSRWILLLLRNGQKQMLGRNEFVFKLFSLVEGRLKNLVQRWRHVDAASGAGYPWNGAQHPLGLEHDCIRVHSALL